MKLSTLTIALAATFAIGSAAPSLALAANAKHPHSNVNHTNDAGNSTGDAAVAKLNQQQLDQIHSGK